jgi:hypothetical protein
MRVRVRAHLPTGRVKAPELIPVHARKLGLVLAVDPLVDPRPRHRRIDSRELRGDVHRARYFKALEQREGELDDGAVGVIEGDSEDLPVVVAPDRVRKRHPPVTTSHQELELLLQMLFGDREICGPPGRHRVVAKDENVAHGYPGARRKGVRWARRLFRGRISRNPTLWAKARARWPRERR